MDLSGLELRRTALGGADLSGANLRGAIVNEDTWLGDAIWNDTTCPDDTNSNDKGGTCEGHLMT